MKFAAIILNALASCPAYAQTFDVASIKPSEPRVTHVRSDGGPGTKDPGLFNCENCSLESLVSMAYEMPQYRMTAPDWMEAAQFVVNAKVPPGATKEQFHLMMKNMLAERFKLAVHREKKEMEFYDLVVAKGGPKLRRSAEEVPDKADAPEPDAKHPGSTQPPKLGKDGYPTLPEGYTSAMMRGRARILYPRQTVEWFADMIAYQLDHPVMDATGLTGKYDFALFWAYGQATAESDPGPTIFEAVQSQLGLKLEQKKGPVEILIVDHMEKVPTEN